ncbi:hypothetical protein [Streptomyces noursei]|uniref:Uncharacterized protein n=2 Tax=Streptomyces noursei TaxID=1971 RepID=A0A401QRI5_STRNR|nr:hypothetical protein [Streptomyces noursei]GCB88011.1 hypothetical protein SALB_00680 [Streptomyces noursei]
MSRYPLRAMLHGGRHTHAARSERGRLVLACPGPHRAAPEEMSDTTPITCPGCKRARAEEAGADPAEL